MYNRCKPMLNVKLNTKLLEYLVVKLSLIIHNNSIREPELVYDRLLKEVIDFALNNVH